MTGNVIMARNFYPEGELIDVLFQKSKCDILIDII